MSPRDYLWLGTCGTIYIFHIRDLSNFEKDSLKKNLSIQNKNDDLVFIVRILVVPQKLFMVMVMPWM